MTSGCLPKIPRFGDNDFGSDALRQRRALCEEVAGRDLPYLGGRSVESESARHKIENMIGYVQVPVGIAGPMRVTTSRGTREVYVPMATTEGAMVASYSRGMRLLGNSANGIVARVTREGLSQHPMFVFDDVCDAIAGARLVEASFLQLQQIVASSTKHGRLTEVTCDVLGRRLVVRLCFFTADAIGINMAARATDLCSREIAKLTGARTYYVHGQDLEKRANSLASVQGRGRSVVAQARVTREALLAAMRVTPEQLVAIWQSYAAGFAQIGTHNWMVQAANGLAAVMLACGQDIAYLPECATGQLDFSVTQAGELDISVVLPSLLLGTVGGGSMQGTARECLDILDCAGDEGANELAEIVAAAVLAGDLSLMSSFCSHEFVDAHERLGRNRPGAS